MSRNEQKLETVSMTHIEYGIVVGPYSGFSYGNKSANDLLDVLSKHYRLPYLQSLWRILFNRFFNL